MKTSRQRNTETEIKGDRKRKKVKGRKIEKVRARKTFRDSV